MGNGKTIPAALMTLNVGGACAQLGQAPACADTPPPCCRSLTPAVWEILIPRLRLSGREVQIIQRLLEDWNEIGIALRIRISRHTVRSHVDRLYHKLDIHSRVQLVVRIFEELLAATAEADSPLPSICAHRTAGRCPRQQPKAAEPAHPRPGRRARKKKGSA